MCQPDYVMLIILISVSKIIQKPITKVDWKINLLWSFFTSPQYCESISVINFFIRAQVGLRRSIFCWNMKLWIMGKFGFGRVKIFVRKGMDKQKICLNHTKFFYFNKFYSTQTNNFFIYLSKCFLCSHVKNMSDSKKRLIISV